MITKASLIFFEVNSVGVVYASPSNDNPTRKAVLAQVPQL
jgi:hypothetical protein